MFFHQRFVPGLAVYSYVVGDEKAGKCVVIDPTRDVDEFILRAEKAGLETTHILETHVHADFISGAVELKHRLGGKPEIHASAMGGPEWTPAYVDHPVRDGDSVELGSLRLEAIHTPGHTPEHVSWALYDTTRSPDTPWLLFSGDFVFIGDVGRPDLLGEEACKELGKQLYESVFETVKALPDFVEIYPSHGAGSLCGKAIGSRSSSTLGFERKFSCAFNLVDAESWVKARLDGMPESPPYFSRSKRINREGPAVLGSPLPGTKALSPSEVAEVSQRGLILDARSNDLFSRGHVPGSINLAMSPTLSTWAGWVLPEATPLALVLEDPTQALEVSTQLVRVGFDQIVGYLDGGIEAWKREGRPLANLETREAKELQELLETQGEDLELLDVRTVGEWQAGHIEGATHVSLGRLEHKLSELPKERALALFCGSGYRSSIAGSIALRHGFEHVLNIRGGMGAWRKEELPVVA